MTLEQKLIKRARRRPLYEIGPNFIATQLGRNEIEKLIPHRSPFLLLDRIDGVDFSERVALGKRQIAHDDPVFAGHFPGAPVYPGVLQIEMAGQLGLCLERLLATGRVEVKEGDKVSAVRLFKVKEAGFVAPTLPGELLTLVAQVVEPSDYLSTCIGQVLGPDGSVRSYACYEVFMPAEEEKG